MLQEQITIISTEPHYFLGSLRNCNLAGAVSGADSIFNLSFNHRFLFLYVYLDLDRLGVYPKSILFRNPLCFVYSGFCLLYSHQVLDLPTCGYRQKLSFTVPVVAFLFFAHRIGSENARVSYKNYRIYFRTRCTTGKLGFQLLNNSISHDYYI